MNISKFQSFLILFCAMFGGFTLINHLFYVEAFDSVLKTGFVALFTAFMMTYVNDFRLGWIEKNEIK